MTANLYHQRYKITEKKGKKKSGTDSNVEITLANSKLRDNFHVILLAKNEDGIKEINTLVSLANDEDHFYFKPRISFDEFLKISDNVIKMSACLASPLWHLKHFYNNYETEIEILNKEIESLNNRLNKLYEESETPTIRKKKKSEESLQREISDLQKMIEAYRHNIEYIMSDMDYISEYNEDSIYDKLLNKYDFLEVQPHYMIENQIEFNKQLLKWSKEYNKPLVCGTDTHSLNQYMAECRSILQKAKKIEFLEEDTADLTCKTYEELFSMFKKQNIFSDEEIKNILNNTNLIAESVEDFTLDTSFKYPIFISPDEDAKEFERRCWIGLKEKIKVGAIKESDRKLYEDRINEELRVFQKVGMSGFMLSMSVFIGELRKQGIPFGFSRGSCFTKSALVKCADGTKTIDKVNIGDMVLSNDGLYHKVTNTQKYHVEEDLVEIVVKSINPIYMIHPTICTLDHKILIKRNGTVSYISAKDISINDMVCYPKNTSERIEQYFTNSISDDDYYYTKIDALKYYKNVKTFVYDITVEESHNFIVNNMIVHNCGGSETAYLTDITDCDPIVWNLSFERFCNESRVSLGD